RDRPLATGGCASARDVSPKAWHSRSACGALPPGGAMTSNARVWICSALFALAVPAIARADEPAEVTCKDGTTSKAGKGACSGHGGIEKAKPKAEAQEKSSSKKSSSKTTAAAPAATEAAEVPRKDGTTSKGGKGGCSGHGGHDKAGGGGAREAASPH